MNNDSKYKDKNIMLMEKLLKEENENIHTDHPAVTVFQ